MGASQGTRGHGDRERHRHRLQGNTGIGETQGPTARGTVTEGDVRTGVYKKQPRVGTGTDTGEQRNRGEHRN